MSFLTNLKIGSRLAIGFAISVVLVCVIGAMAIWQIGKVYQKTDEISGAILPTVQALSDVRSMANTVRRTTLRGMLESDQQGRDMQREAHDVALRQYESLFARYKSLGKSSDDTRLIQDIEAGWATFLKNDRRLLEAVAAGKTDALEMRTLATRESANEFASFVKVVDAAVQANRERSDSASTFALTSYHSAVLSTVILVAVAVAAGIAIAILITRSITRPLTRAVAVAQNVAQGDLTSDIDANGKDETAMLLAALKEMNARLARMVGDIQQSADSIATASSEIAAGNVDLSQRTEEQAASLEETAASMEQLTAAVKQNADNAQQGSTVAKSASEVAEHGGTVVSRVVDTMQEISERAGRMSSIITAIEGIAFQTNILALNAAVEAARAGEQGRGFAVVAAEVRTLAQRSAAAAKEIKDLITESADGVSKGETLVAEAGATMKDVVAAVARVNDLMEEISAASQEQRKGIEQVNQAVTQMDEVTQQNAALVEEAAAAAQSMSSQSSSLKDLISVFRISASRASGPDESPRASAHAPRRALAARGNVAAALARSAAPALAAAKSPACVSNSDWQKF
ncbi:MCP four helix bundle domain-containing protein [Burkholderia plantarii]|uniref:methyl-accepting chemotaxis protein n=1 Tax=Burkholderia plantarii TaxID=41899 RepID=UPI00272D8F41|nr:methyl-accepting chemotaxis protein [Burkholderia plantarii]WLE59673.1 MCP four helix bundle domain-containing protein [Burkholderia plantarii]